MIDGAVCYLTLCSKDYSKRLAFSYLENIAQEFQAQYSRQVHTVSRPYSFIEFGEYRLSRLPGAPLFYPRRIREISVYRL